MTEFKDRIIKLINDGKNISVELPNDIFIKDLLVELEDSKSCTINIIDTQNLTSNFSNARPFVERFQYHKLEYDDLVVKSNNFIESTFVPSMNLKPKRMECYIRCVPKLLCISSENNIDCGEVVETILDYVGCDMLKYDRSDESIFIFYNSYEVDEREV